MHRCLIQLMGACARLGRRATKSFIAAVSVGATAFSLVAIPVQAAAQSGGGILSPSAKGTVASSGSRFVLETSVGYARLKSNELVYDDAGKRLSQLIWKTDAPVLNVGATARFNSGWIMSAKAQGGLYGNSYMEDYDWLAPYSHAGAPDDQWSDRSRHKDTELDRYFNLDVALGRDFRVGGTLANLHGGFKYTNVKRTAYGGDYVYSQNGFRDRVGKFAPNEAGITYEQDYPSVFAGIGARGGFGAWSLSGLGRGGLSIGAGNVDHHWKRDLRFEEDYPAVPFVSLEGQVDYAFNERSGAFLSGRFEHFFRMKGDTTIYRNSTNQALATFTDGGGMDFQSVTLGVGFKRTF